MMTELKKYLKDLRAKNNEVMKDMAKRLGVSTSFLSNVELGNKNMPQSMFNNIIREYKIVDDITFSKAVQATMNKLVISLDGFNEQQRDIVVKMVDILKKNDEEHLSRIMSAMDNSDDLIDVYNLYHILEKCYIKYDIVDFDVFHDFCMKALEHDGNVNALQFSAKGRGYKVDVSVQPKNSNIILFNLQTMFDGKAEILLFNGISKKGKRLFNNIAYIYSIFVNFAIWDMKEKW